MNKFTVIYSSSIIIITIIMFWWQPHISFLDNILDKHPLRFTGTVVLISIMLVMILSFLLQEEKGKRK